MTIILSAVSFAVSSALCFLLIFLHGRVGKFGVDHVTKEPQKFHVDPTPRTGGVAIFSAIVVMAVLLWLARKSTVSESLLVLLVCGLPAFLAGMFEDLTKKVSPTMRLLMSFLSGFLALAKMSIFISTIDIPLIDNILKNNLIHYMFFVFAIGGVVNAFNIIDGFNGLMSGVALMVFAVSGLIAHAVGDSLMVRVFAVILFTVFGFFVFNFPFGKIFAGDAGAYFLGFLGSTTTLLLVQRNREISAWYVVLILIYPVWETLFSIFRKAVIMAKSPIKPDGYHFHMLIFKSFSSQKAGSKGEANLAFQNARTSLFLWIMNLTAAIPALVFFGDKKRLIVSIFIFIVAYTVFYISLFLMKDKDESAELI